MGFESKITSKGQTTIPSDVRNALELTDGDTVLYVPSELGSFQIYRKNLKVSELAGLLGEAENGKSLPGDTLDEAIDDMIQEQYSKHESEVS